MAWSSISDIQKGNLVYVHCNGQVAKVSACRSKQYELRERELEKNEEQKKEEEGNEWNKWIEEDENKEIEKVDKNKEI